LAARLCPVRLREPWGLLIHILKYPSWLWRGLRGLQDWKWKRNRERKGRGKGGKEEGLCPLIYCPRTALVARTPTNIGEVGYKHGF